MSDKSIPQLLSFSPFAFPIYCSILKKFYSSQSFFFFGLDGYSKFNMADVIFFELDCKGEEVVYAFVILTRIISTHNNNNNNLLKEN